MGSPWVAPRVWRRVVQLFDNWCEQILIDRPADKLAFFYHFEADKLQSKSVLLPVADTSSDLNSEQARMRIWIRGTGCGKAEKTAIDTSPTHSFSHSRCSRSQFPYIFPLLFYYFLWFFLQTKVNSIDSRCRKRGSDRRAGWRRSMPQ